MSFPVEKLSLFHFAQNWNLDRAIFCLDFNAFARTSFFPEWYWILLAENADLGENLINISNLPHWRPTFMQLREARNLMTACSLLSELLQWFKPLSPWFQPFALLDLQDCFYHCSGCFSRCYSRIRWDLLALFGIFWPSRSCSHHSANTPPSKLSLGALARRRTYSPPGCWLYSRRKTASSRCWRCSNSLISLNQFLSPTQNRLKSEWDLCSWFWKLGFLRMLPRVFLWNRYQAKWTQGASTVHQKF